ncbi:hypothetical protein BC939DRAFT_508287 [Gamsiella multidivaricata]|uniref:uncharacterized protein n=1 Tax=Gamsiella multidivaricata TaxID=101098 RepID=UPI00221ED6CE|nr:uncharacterized protein BC939DRAFT_508287 [Gamsiella multidivaricata]KAI7816453.1 hypothetical protein BC939DRAFT_508287 [Gamsiella multidivaricata]
MELGWHWDGTGTALERHWNGTGTFDQATAFGKTARRCGAKKSREKDAGDAEDFNSAGHAENIEDTTRILDSEDTQGNKKA